jgi:DNA polymerase III subunit gamma/tau
MQEHMTYQVIARKWRPQTFADLVGQTHVTETLANAIRNNRVAHAYIFSGARGVGKTTAARILAKALNCVKGPTPEPCGECDSCKEIASGTSLDVIEIDAASNRGIDQIRELREMVRYSPAAARHKVVILDEAHMLTGEASNALLKTLEEPPDRVIFVMATTEPENLEDTIRSRSQHFHFRALTFAEITSRLKYIAEQEKLKIDDGALSVIARMAEGSMRDALSLLEQARAYCGDDIKDKEVRELLGVVPEDALQELVEAIAERSAERALGLVHRFQREGRNLQHFCREAIRHMRNLLIVRVCGEDSDLIAATPDQRPGLAKAAALFTEEDLTRYFQILLQTDNEVRREMDPRVHLEMGLLRLVNAARLAPLEELLSELSGSTRGRTGGGSAPRSATPTAKTPQFPSRTATAGAAPAAVAPRVTSDYAIPPGIEKAPASLPASGQPLRSSGQAEGGRYTGEVELRPTAVVSTFAAGGSAAAAAPARKSAEDMAASNAEATTDVVATGLRVEQVNEIKSSIQAQQKFIAELLEHASRWELEASELRIYFPSQESAFAGLIEGRETLDKIRTSSSKVLGRAVRVCAKLESGPAQNGNGANATMHATTQQMRAQFENDPMVKSMLQRFGGRISEVRRRTGE